MNEGPTWLSRMLAWLWPTRPELHASRGRQTWLLSVYTIRRWIGDGCPNLASSLALQTLLSIVPLVGVVLFFVRMLDPEVGSQFVIRLANALSPRAGTSQEFTDMVLELGSRVSVSQLGAVGFLAVIVLAYLLFSTLERTFNRIWGVSSRRRTVAKFTTFYALASLFPVLVFYSLAQPVLSDVTHAFLVTPILTTSLGFVLLNRMMPRQRVRWRAALAGGVFSAVAFELTKIGFGEYLSNVAMRTYEGVYGSLAVLPVFVIWTYLSWMVVLLGAELTFAIHNLGAISESGWVQSTDRAKDAPQATPGRGGARIMLAICDNFDRRELGTSVERLHQRYKMRLGDIVALLDALEDRGFIVPVAGSATGYVPARPLDRIRVADVLHMFDADLRMGRGDALADRFAALDAFAEETIGELTFLDLVRSERTRRAETSESDRDADDASEDVSTGAEVTPLHPPGDA
jgi:membrane protein